MLYKEDKKIAHPSAHKHLTNINTIVEGVSNVKLVGHKNPPSIP